MHWNSQFWYSWNWFIVFPLTFCTIYRFFTQEDNKRGVINTYTIDYICRILLAPAVIYYIIDMYLLLSQPDKFGWCNLAFFLHHVVTVAGFYPTFTIPQFPWFYMICFACHCLLIMFPYHTDLNYLYLAVILNCMKRLVEEPYVHLNLFQMILKVILVLLACPIVMLWWFECKNDMLNI
jgi:hypothetical protein